jgi:WD40 repeat protein
LSAAAVQAARAAQAQADEAAAAAAAEGAGPAIIAAAQIAAHDAMIAASQQCLPLNICECSPDGKWLAVGVDQAAVLLIPAGVGYQHKACKILDMCPLLSPRMGDNGHQGTLGCQYVAFNSSSSLLAATSDHLRMVSVFDVVSGQLVATFSLHNRPLLPVRFVSASSNGARVASKQQQQQDQQQALHSAADGAVQLLPPPGSQAGSSSSSGSSSTWGDWLLVYCEISGGLHIADLR